MPRTATQSTELAADATLKDGLNVTLNEMAEHRIAVMNQFGDGAVYERDRIVHETRFYMAQSAEAMLEAGKRLVILKENEPHGDFTEIIESQLGLSKRTAQVMMQASLKYLSPKLESKAQALALLGKTKLFELMTEDDEELAALAEGGTVAGMTLDDIDRMTSRELKAALRDARADADAQRRVLSDKNEKIDDLSARLEKKSRISLPTPSEEAEKLRKEVSAIAYDAESAMTVRLHTAFSTLQQYCMTHQIDTPVDFMNGLICQVESAINNLRNSFDLEATPTGTNRPAWIDASEGE
ncbi:DUF3102 domain-containing protein [Pectobacterium versatile]|uniref:DUF3102 domain-containing protein n=1 Tax=Pectobacterium versatile TaxID=2488639 RepID=UPI000DE64B9F|nr:DUF3102 domain-containing protein [Pectobacterium versatile]PVY74767.1 hypothetical protein C7330_4081 [Pectobacterium versatile]